MHGIVTQHGMMVSVSLLGGSSPGSQRLDPMWLGPPCRWGSGISGISWLSVGRQHPAAELGETQVGEDASLQAGGQSVQSPHHF